MRDTRWSQCKGVGYREVQGNQRDGKLTVSYSVPFTGSKELLEYLHTAVYGSIRDGRIIINTVDDHEPSLRERDRWYACICKRLKQNNKQAERFNKTGIDTKAEYARSAADVMSALEHTETHATGERSVE